MEIEPLFNWNDVPGNDSERLIKFLKDNLKIEWVENAEIRKTNDGKTITITKDSNSLAFKLNQKKRKAILEISGGKTHEYILEEENGKIKIYEIVKPSNPVIEEYLKKWDSLENYVQQERSLKKLFTETYKSNVEMEDVLIKVCSLNDFYSTNIFYPFIVAKHIVKLKIDDGLKKNEEKLVNDIAKIEVPWFNWNDVPGNDSKQLVDYLVKGLKRGWAKTAEIKKNDDDKIIMVTNEKNKIIFKLNENTVSLEINGKKFHEYIFKKEGGNLKIYKERNLYSFATKYCSHHKPEDYPIYDSFVEKLLLHFKREDTFYEFRKSDLKKYSAYKNILREFKKFYGLKPIFPTIRY
ncbi:hypothetical protein BEH94_10640 [Candidatus Altiarchaeales archaeon WOR_SM1_SCG]|nr:hypothetical protein BEH94_10640 [Candidatus Altiarchaeales archaeon WOR_SM1_SCG]